MKGLGNIGNLGAIMKQAQQVMQQSQEVERELSETRIEATSGGGMVRATVTGRGEVLEIKIDPQVVDPSDVQMLEDLVVSAIREATERAQAIRNEKVKELTGGLGIGDMFGV